MRVAIIGAGISGLATAYYLQKLGIPYDLFEAATRVGGNIHTIRKGDYLLELGPNTLHGSPEVKELIRELKLEQQVLLPATDTFLPHVLRDGAYQPLPHSPHSFRVNTFFSAKAKRRILHEKRIPPADIVHETIAQFFERRFGREVVEYAISPLVTGLCVGDPEQLLISKAFPNLKELEHRYGSVLRGLARQKPKALQEEIFSFVNGMSTLPEAIAAKLISLHTAHRVDIITRGHGKYILSCSAAGDHDTEEYDALVLALPAHQAAHLLHYTFPGMAAALLNIDYPPMAVVHSVYHKRNVHHPLSGYGGVHPKAAAAFVVGSVWSSALFEGRCRPHEVLFTTFVSGSQYAAYARQSTTELMQRVHQELCRQHCITADTPVFQHAATWEHSLPQYDLYIEDAHHMARRLEPEGLFIAANWQAELSVAGCIRHAREVARKINLSRSLALNS